MISTSKIPNKILILPSWYNDGFNSNRGIFFKEQAKALSNNGYDITILAVTPYSLRDVIKNRRAPKRTSINSDSGFTEIIAPWPNIPKLKPINYLIRYFLTIKHFKRLYKTGNRPDIIHVHSYKAGLPAIDLGRKYNIPVIITEHSSQILGSVIGLDRKIAGSVFKKADKLIAVSSVLSAYVKDLGNQPCDVIPNMINIEAFKPTTGKNNKNEFVFINIGGFSRAKGGDLLIESFKKAAEKSTVKLKLIIIGGGSLRESMEKQVEHLNLSESIEFKGYVERDKLFDIINTGDALLVTSRSETFGIALIEAMACGLPVVSTRCGGPEDIITSDKLGILCGIDTESISGAMLELIGKKDTYSKETIRESVEKRFSEQVVASKLETVYTSVMNNGVDKWD